MESQVEAAPSVHGIEKGWAKFLLQVIILWSAGFREACCFHRVVFFCKRSKTLFKRTGQCFLFNGCIFLGSIFLLRSVITPTLQWILPVRSQSLEATDAHDFQISEAGERFYMLLQAILIGLFYVFWFYPMYVFSFIISSMWYNEIAQQAFKVMEESEQDSQRHNSENNRFSNSEFASSYVDNCDGLEGMMIMIGEQVYSVLVLSIFFIEVFLVSFIPYIGQILNFLLLSWIYAYYCFEYKWNFTGWSLEKRLLFFETNWAFFAGFGNWACLSFNTNQDDWCQVVHVCWQLSFPLNSSAMELWPYFSPCLCWLQLHLALSKSLITIAEGGQLGDVATFLISTFICQKNQKVTMKMICKLRLLDWDSWPASLQFVNIVHIYQ